MGEATGSGGGRAKLERSLVQRSLTDESFRRRLLEDPRAVLELELEASLPEGVRVVALEETADTIYLVLPNTTAVAQEAGGGLSDHDLESVAGGDTNWTCSGWSCGPPSQCQTAVGPGC